MSNHSVVRVLITYLSNGKHHKNNRVHRCKFNIVHISLNFVMKFTEFNTRMHSVCDNKTNYKYYGSIRIISLFILNRS